MRLVELFLAAHPELAVFLVLGLGYVIGRIGWRGFAIGPVTGCLFAGLLVGQVADVPVSDTAKSILFLLFLFGIGYSVGPRFLAAIRGDGLPAMVIGIIVPLSGLATAVMVAKALSLDVGFAAGLYSGGLTESPAIGTAAEAIKALPLAEAERLRLTSHIAVADGLTYLFGTVGVILMTSVIGPLLLRVNLREAARELEHRYGFSAAKPGVHSAWRPIDVRAYAIAEGSPAAGLSIAEAEAAVKEARVFFFRVRRSGALIEAAPSLVLQAGDVVAATGRREALINAIGTAGPEVEDPELLDIPTLTQDAYVSNAAVAGKPLRELAEQYAERGLFVRRILRGGLAIPVAPGTVILRGDRVSLTGPEAAVNRAVAIVGQGVSLSETTDFATLGFAIFLGGVAGMLIGFQAAGVRVTLGISVGTLLAGLVIGWVRSRRPHFVPVPEPVVSFMTAIGLAAFVGMVGLHAGPIFVSAVKEVGIGLLLGGMVVTLVPQFVGLLVGHYVLRMNPILLLGALAGAQTVTAGLAALQERSGSPVGVLGYSAAVPFGHVLLTSGGTAVVWLMT